jgi:DNA-binding NarL/FixJ family response regulator
VAARNVFTLTAREEAILKGILRGDTIRQIAEAQGLGRQTVKNYVTTIYEKLGVANRLHLLRVAGRTAARRSAVAFPPGG